MRNHNVIVLSAGKIQHENLSLGMVSEEGMLPVRGKPSLIWSIDSLVKNSYTNINIVIRKTNKRLKKILEFYFDNIEIILYNEQLHIDNILSSLKQGLSNIDINKPTLILLGDCFINGEIPNSTNFVLTSENVMTSKQWCLISKDKNDNVLDIYDKKKSESVTGKEALVGCYCFSDTVLLLNSLDRAIKEDKKEISDILNFYKQVIPLKAIKTHEWLDFGHVTGAVKARLALFNAREFNNISVDTIKGTLIKKSKKKQKLLDEVNWYKSLPSEISTLVPRVLCVKETESKISIEMEMYGYPNLAELFLYGQNILEDWIFILKALFKMYKKLQTYTEKSDSSEQKEIYINKTLNRLASLKNNSFFNKLLNEDYININGIKYRNYNLFSENLLKKIQTLINNDLKTIVHGDFCFSNILFDPMHFTFKLIDPRGRFLNQSIYGDSRYDIAKLRHSIIGKYDYIVAGLYNIKQISDTEFDFEIFHSKLSFELGNIFDNMIIKNGFDLEEIKLIEAILFLTMIPYHSDDRNRQQAFYLIAIRKINEVLYG